MNESVGPVVIAMVESLRKKGYVVAEMGQNEIQRSLQRKVDSLDTTAVFHVVEEVYDGNFVYRAIPRHDGPGGEEKLYRRGYTVEGDDTDMILAAETEEVVKKVEYVTTNEGDGAPSGREKMKIEELVQNLIACEGTRFEEKDADWLKDLSEEQLEKLAPAEEEKPKEEEEKPAEKSEKAEEKPAEKSEKAEEKPAEKSEKTEEKPEEEEKEKSPVALTAKEYVEAAPSEFRDVLTNALDLMTAKREHLIKGIVKNSNGVYVEKELGEQTVRELEKLAKVTNVPEDYTGSGGGAPVILEDDDQPPPPPRVFLRKGDKE